MMRTKKGELTDNDEMSPQLVYQPVGPSGLCVRTIVYAREKERERAKQGERPREIERKVSGQRLSEIYPHSEAWKREDAGS